MGIKNAVRNRPVRVLGFVAAIHAVIYGLGYIFAIGGFTGTVLYVTLQNFLTREAFGTALLSTGLLLAFAYVRNNPKTIRAASVLCGMVWFFATFSYLVTGAWMLAIGISLPWALIANYLAYAHKNRQQIIDYDKTPQAIQDTLDEDKL